MKNEIRRKNMTIQNVKRLAVIDGETLMDARLPKRTFCVETLLPEGISMLGGAPKVGKSWMVLLLALQVAKGEPLWNLPTKQGTVLYLALEVSKQLQSFDGGNTELAEKFNSFSRKNISAKALKQLMNKWRYTLEENDVFFTSGRSNGKRYIKTWYLPSAEKSDESAV